MKKKLTAIALSVLALLNAVGVSAFNVVDLPETMTLSEALEIYDAGEILNAFVTDIEDGLCIQLSADEIKDFYYSAQGVELSRRINPSPFRGIVLNIYTTSGEAKTFNLNSGVQVGKYGDRNYVCYTMDPSDMMDYMYLDSLYHESENKIAAPDFVPQVKYDFLKLPQDKWAIEPIKEAASRSLIPYELTSDYGAYISREYFCKLLGNFIAVVSGYASLEDYMKYNAIYYDDRGFVDCEGRDESIFMLSALGIVNGKGNGRFEPDAALTREEAAKLVTETAGKFRHIESFYQIKYSDRNEISPWAEFYVTWVTEQGIMSGVSSEHFAPKQYYTCQQAIATVTRLYNVCD